jgi:hypothetical protein
MYKNFLIVLISSIIVLSCDVCKEPITSDSASKPNNNQNSLLDISGKWIGIAYGLSDIPEDPNPRIELDLIQEDTIINGTFKVLGVVDTIYSGLSLNNKLKFILKNTYENIKYEFVGDLVDKKFEGIYEIKNLTTDSVYTQNSWFVEKE